MSSKTEREEDQDYRLHPARIISMAVFIFVVLVVGGDMIRSQFGLPAGYSPGRMITPWGFAGAIRTAEAIAAFSGSSSSIAWPTPLGAVLGLMVLWYIMGPGMLNWGLRRRVDWLRNHRQKVSATAIVVAIAFGLACVTITGVTVTIGLWSPWQKWDRIQEDTKSSEERDVLTGILVAYSNQLRVVRAMPGRKDVPSAWQRAPGEINEDDILSGLRSMQKGLLAEGTPPGARYVLEHSSPDSITMWAVGNTRSAFHDSVFCNKDARTGMVQVRIGITPTTETVVVEN